MKIKILSTLIIAATAFAACNTTTPKSHEEKSEDIVYDGPECVEDYEPTDGNAKEASYIVVNKASLTLKLYDKKNRLICSFPVAAGRIYGNKQKNGDLRSPEGEFKIEQVQASSNWMDGSFGPWFMRLNVPDIASVGICGTLQPELVGTRSSSGNIVLRNEHLDSLHNMVSRNMRVTILPAKEDLRADGKLIEGGNMVGEEMTESADGTDKSTALPAKDENKAKNDDKKSIAATTDSNGDVWHTIAKGEYISTIAAKYGTTTSNIKKLNPGINVDKIREGQRIKVYGAEIATTTADNAKAQSATPTGEVWYTVVEGDLAGKIASKHNISLSQLKKLNPNKNLDRIYPGQKLRVK